jgi:Fic family protein
MGVIGCIIGLMIRTDTIQITPEILGMIAKIDEFKGAWRALGTLAPDRMSALRRVATIESIGSSTRIEGGRLSDREVARLLSCLQIKTFATRDEQEVAGYAEVMDLVFSSWQDITLTESHIRQMHCDLLVYSEKDAWHRGDYKTSSKHFYRYKLWAGFRMMIINFNLVFWRRINVWPESMSIKKGEES